MLNFIFSIPLPWLVPFYSFHGVFIYLTIKSFKKYFEIIFQQKPTVIIYETPCTLEEDPSGFYDEVRRNLLNDAKRESVCFLLKVLLLLIIVIIDLGGNLTIYLTIFLVTGMIFVGVATFLNIGSNMFLINLIFLISAFLLWGIAEGHVSTDNSNQGNISTVSNKELENK